MPETQGFLISAIHPVRIQAVPNSKMELFTDGSGWWMRTFEYAHLPLAAQTSPEQAFALGNHTVI
jgi:hypothetical protein